MNYAIDSRHSSPPAQEEAEYVTQPFRYKAEVSNNILFSKFYFILGQILSVAYLQNFRASLKVYQTFLSLGENLVKKSFSNFG